MGAASCFERTKVCLPMQAFLRVSPVTGNMTGQPSPRSAAKCAGKGRGRCASNASPDPGPVSKQLGAAPAEHIERQLRRKYADARAVAQELAMIHLASARIGQADI